MGASFTVYNPEAVEEVEQYLKLQEIKKLPTSMGDIQRRFSAIPYGWREIDIAAVICNLIANQVISIRYSGSIIQPTDKKIPDYLRRKTEVDKTLVEPKVAPPADLIKRAREILKEYFNTMDVPSDVDGLISYILDGFTKEKENLHALIDNNYAGNAYPDKTVVEGGIKLCEDLLLQKKDNIALLKKLVALEDDFKDFMEDMSDVQAFFKNQKNIFDSAAKLLKKLSAESEYLQAEQDAIKAMSQIRMILAMPKPYKKISELPNLIQDINNVYGKLLDMKKEEVISDIQAAMAEIHQTADVDQKDIVTKADDALVAKRDSANVAETLTSLDAMKIQVANIRQQYLKALVVEPDSGTKTVTISRASVCFSAKLENEADIDNYLAELKEKLMEKLEGNDVLHII